MLRGGRGCLRRRGAPALYLPLLGVLSGRRVRGVGALLCDGLGGTAFIMLTTGLPSFRERRFKVFHVHPVVDEFALIGR